MSGSYAVLLGQLSTPDAQEGRSHICHETCSLPYTKILRSTGSHQQDWELGQMIVHVVTWNKSKMVRGPVLMVIL